MFSFIIHGQPIINNIIRANITYSLPSKKLLGKRIIITGGNSGVGFAMAKKFVKEGAIVLIAGRNQESLKKASNEVGCLYLELDVQQIDTFENFLSNSYDLLGGIDILVNNAGISLHEGLWDNVTPKKFDSQMDTNLKGPYFLSQKFVKLLDEKKQDQGQILFISSERGTFVDYMPYGLTKVALNSFVKGLSYLLVNKGIRVNAIAPGITTSKMTGYTENGNLYNSYNIKKRVYLAGEIAEVTCFVLSNNATCISGQIIECNNGNSINAHWK